jgi:hypothetical protein
LLQRTGGWPGGSSGSAQIGKVKELQRQPNLAEV